MIRSPDPSLISFIYLPLSPSPSHLSLHLSLSPSPTSSLPTVSSHAHSSGDLSSTCTRVWRRAMLSFLLPIRFCGSQSPSWLFPLARYWLVKHNDDREATAYSQSRTGSVELDPLFTPLVLKIMMAASPDQRAIYD
jgi:hypothetical protein